VGTGRVLAGILGTAAVRLEYPVIGDPVNLASRLGDLAAKAGGDLVADGDTAAEVMDNRRYPSPVQPVSFCEIQVKDTTRTVPPFPGPLPPHQP